MKKKRESKPMDLSKSGADTMKSNYREALDMVLLEKSQAQLEQEVAESEVLELQAHVEDLKKKILDLSSAERSLKTLLGEEVDEAAPVPQPIVIPFVPGQPYIMPQPYVPNDGGIWTSPNTSPSWPTPYVGDVPYVGDGTSGGWVGNGGAWGGNPFNRPTITFQNGSNHQDGNFFTTEVDAGILDTETTPCSSFAVTDAIIKDAMISGHMSWTTSGSCAITH